MEIDKLKEDYERNASISIDELLGRQIEREGLKNTIGKYCIMRDSLWRIVEKSDNSDASDITDAIAVIDCILYGLQKKYRIHGED